jgi:hypothetical protein
MTSTCTARTPQLSGGPPPSRSAASKPERDPATGFHPGINARGLPEHQRPHNQPRKADHVSSMSDPKSYADDLQAHQEVVGVILQAGMEHITRGKLQRVVLNTGQRAVGPHLEASGHSALPHRVLLQRRSDAATP